jgi:hypothetical protein
MPLGFPKANRAILSGDNPKKTLLPSLKRAGKFGLIMKNSYLFSLLNQ